MARAKTPRVAGSVQLEVGRGTVANPRWMALLEALATSRTITGAAKSAGLSYKAAWDAIDTMNNLAGEPLVATAVGGKGGGGARLTAQGEALLKTYREAAAEHELFVARMNSKLGDASGDLRALGRLASRTSARNQWSGKVGRVRRGAVNDEVELVLHGGDRIVAIATHESVEHLGLAAGGDALALVKASSVLIGVGKRGTLKLSARNQLHGKVARIVPGAVNTEVVVALRGGNSVAAIVTKTSVKELGLAVGQQAVAIFKASSVILGVA
jgi:molybdate transport system regulatory protein